MENQKKDVQVLGGGGVNCTYLDRGPEKGHSGAAWRGLGEEKQNLPPTISASTSATPSSSSMEAEVASIVTSSFFSGLSPWAEAGIEGLLPYW